MSKSIEEDKANEYLFLLNQWGQVQSPPLECKYKTYKDFKAKYYSISKQKAFDKIERAYKFFVNKETYQGAKPNLNDYFDTITDVEYQSNSDDTDDLNTEEINEVKDLFKKDVNLNSKTDFLFKEMSFKSLKDFDPKPRLTKEQRAALNKEILNKKTAAFPSLWAVTKEGLGVSHNPNYLRKDFFEDIVKAKHPTWERTTNRDVDGDNENDIAIWDGPGRDTKNLKYYNGWGISNNKLARPYVDYLIKNPTADQGYTSGFLPQRPEHKEHKPIINIDAIKSFSDFVDEIVKALGELTPKLRMIMSQFGFKQKLKSMINRFVILPYALVKLGYNPQEFKPIIYSDQAFMNNKKLMSMYRSKAVRKVWSEEGEAIIEYTIKGVQDNIIQLVKANPAMFIDYVIKGDNKIRDLLYNDAVGAAKASNDGMNLTN